MCLRYQKNDMEMVSKKSNYRSYASGGGENIVSKGER